MLPYVTDELRESCKAIHFVKPNGKPDVGYDAILIPLVCDLYLEADQAVPRILVKSQENMVEKAKILVRSLAKVGITALIDEATGYQYDREKNELQKLLSKYIAEEFLPWTSRFPREYYQQIFRLYRWEYDPLSLKRTPYIGKFTNEYVYNEMSPEILKELREVNPSDDNGRRKRRHHQHLTEDIGVAHLQRHLDKLITVMKLSDNVEDFKKNFQRAFKKPNTLKSNLEDTKDTK